MLGRGASNWEQTRVPGPSASGITARDLITVSLLRVPATRTLSFTIHQQTGLGKGMNPVKCERSKSLVRSYVTPASLTAEPGRQAHWTGDRREQAQGRAASTWSGGSSRGSEDGTTGVVGDPAQCQSRYVGRCGRTEAR